MKFVVHVSAKSGIVRPNSTRKVAMEISEFKAKLVLALAPSFVACHFSETDGRAVTREAADALFQITERIAERALAAGYVSASVRLDETETPTKAEEPASLAIPPKNVVSFLSRRDGTQGGQQT